MQRTQPQVVGKAKFWNTSGEVLMMWTLGQLWKSNSNSTIVSRSLLLSVTKGTWCRAFSVKNSAITCLFPRTMSGGWFSASACARRTPKTDSFAPTTVALAVANFSQLACRRSGIVAAKRKPYLLHYRVEDSLFEYCAALGALQWVTIAAATKPLNMKIWYCQPLLMR